MDSVVIIGLFPAPSPMLISWFWLIPSLARFHSQSFCQEDPVVPEFLKCLLILLTSENICCLYAWGVPCLDRALLVFLSFCMSTVSSLHRDAECCAGQSESSLTLSLLDGHSLFKPRSLRNCYFFIDVTLFNQDISWCWTLCIFSFSWKIMYCGFCSSCISDSAGLYHSILFHLIIFPFHFLVSLNQGH